MAAGPVIGVNRPAVSVRSRSSSADNSMSAASALLASLLIAGAIACVDHFIFNGIGLGVSIVPVLLLIGGASLLTAATAFFMAWGSAHVRPLEVLRYE